MQQVQFELQKANSVNPHPCDATWGCAGDGVTDDTVKFAAFEAAVFGRVIDLTGHLFVLSAYPTANTYINGGFVLGGLTYSAAAARAMITGTSQGFGGAFGTGQGIDAAYTGGLIHNPTTGGRTCFDLYVLVGSQNCVSEGPSRAGNYSSIYSWARGNVSANLAARHSLAWVPQSVNIASEECRVTGGFRGANIASIYSSCENESNANIACRNASAASRNGANIASDNSRTGRGNKAIILTTVSGGVLTGLSLAIGNDGTTVFRGEDYIVGDPLVFFDTLAASPTYPVATVASVDGSGGILTFTITSGGSGLTTSNGPTNQGLLAKVDNDTGDFSFNAASIGSKAQGLSSTNIAQGNGVASGIGAGNYSGQNNTASGNYSGNFGSESCVASTTEATNIGSSGSTASGTQSVNAGTIICTTSGTAAVTVGRRTLNDQSYSLALGNNGTGSATTANRKIHLFGSNGNIQAAGTITGSVVFADYAEMFPNKVRGEIPLGSIVAGVGEYVRACEDGDHIRGVVSATALIVAGDSPFTWSQRYMTGDFGELLYEDVWDEDAGHMVKQPIENPDFDPSKDNTPRSERPEEWTKVGILGQVHVRVDQSVEAGNFVACGTGGVGKQSLTETRLECMSIRKPYDASKGYAVAFCLIR